MSYVLRVQLPDQPGSLGAVATALGHIGADILAMDVVERTAGVAVDDITVTLPGQPDRLITAAESIPGVRVESVRPDPGVLTSHREWELIEAITSHPAEALAILTDGVPDVLRAGWAVALEVGANGQIHTLASGGGAPEITECPWLPLHRAGRLDETAHWVPASWQQLGTALAACPLGSAQAAILIGRPGGPAFRDSEVSRLLHLAGLTVVVLHHDGHGVSPDLPAPGAIR